jgi:hypothetical protein
LAVAGTIEIIVLYDLTPLNALVNVIFKSGHVPLSARVHASSRMGFAIQEEPGGRIDDVGICVDINSENTLNPP